MKINGRPQPGPGAGDVVSMKSSAVDICISSFICVMVCMCVRHVMVCGSSGRVGAELNITNVTE